MSIPGRPEIVCPSCHATMPYTAAACPGCRRRMIGVGVSASLAARASAADLGPTPFAGCREKGCGYFVAARDERCPNCGAEKPFSTGPSFPYSSFPWRAFAAGLVAVFCALVLLELLLDSSGAILEPAGSALLLTFCLAFFFLLAWAGLVLARRLLNRRGSAGEQEFALRQGEQAIIGRLVELKRRQQQIEGVLARAQREEGSRAVELRAPLEAALETLSLQHARYSLKLLEIEAARWQNRLAPLIHNLEALTFEQNENRLRAVEGARREGAALRAKAERLRAPLKDSSEAGKFARKLGETLASCEKMQDALLDRQAVLALKGVTPLEDSLRERPAAPAPDEIDVFNLQVSITDFSSSFDELEDEYRRVRDEVEVGERVRQITGG